MPKITDAAQKERAWFRRQKGYLRDEVTRDVVRLEKRLAVLEALLRPAYQARDDRDRQVD